MKFFVLVVMLISSLSFANETVEKKKFNEVLSQYEKLHEAFFANNGEKIVESAKSVLEKLNQIEDKQIQEKLNYSKKKLNEIISTKDVEIQKNAMNTVSQAFLVVLEKDIPNENYARYYCPMEKKYWIQNVSETEKVQNPYASSTMPTCGVKK